MITLPDILAVQHTAVHNGDLVLLGPLKIREDTPSWEDRENALVWVGRDGTHTTMLGPDLDTRCWASLLAHPAGGVVVVRDLEHALYVGGPEAAAIPLPISGAELLAAVSPKPILHGGSAVSDELTWHVVLSHGNLMADLRYAAPLTVDLAAGTARWESAPWTLDPAEFPRDLAGIEDYDPHVSISVTLLRAGTVHACSAGSDIRTMGSRGTDFFSLVRVTRDGHVLDRIHEESGWKLDGKKRGIYARFTADGTYAILTPAFRSGGRPRVLRLTDGALLTPKLPRGLTKAEILDHHPERGWWLRLDNTVTVIPDLVPAGS